MTMTIMRFKSHLYRRRRHFLLLLLHVATIVATTTLATATTITTQVLLGNKDQEKHPFFSLIALSFSPVFLRFTTLPYTILYT
jgi:hypothetical protein